MQVVSGHKSSFPSVLNLCSKQLIKFVFFFCVTINDQSLIDLLTASGHVKLVTWTKEKGDYLHYNIIFGSIWLKHCDQWNVMRCFLRKPAFCICEIKGADKLHGNRAADQRLCFRYIASTISLLP